MRHLFRRILLILAFTLVLLILGAATASANTTHGFDNGSWYGDVTHLDWNLISAWILNTRSGQHHGLLISLQCQASNLAWR